MLTVSINGAETQIEEPLSLADIVARHASGNRPVAAAVNGEFVPRSEYADRTLSDGDLVDIVSPVGGG